MIVMEFCSGNSLLHRVRDIDNPVRLPSLGRRGAAIIGRPLPLGVRGGVRHGVSRVKERRPQVTLLLEERTTRRDIAARNCLISAKDDAKISDFGLSLKTKETKEKKIKAMPIRFASSSSRKKLQIHGPRESQEGSLLLQGFHLFFTRGLLLVGRVVLRRAHLRGVHEWPGPLCERGRGERPASQDDHCPEGECPSL